MIDNKELRVGNNVLSGGEISVPCVIRIINVDEENTYYPILLTPDILNKFGWEYSDSGYATAGYWEEEEGFFAIGPGYDYEKEKEDGFVFTANGNEYVSSKPIYYLHQLQNLYHSLTGTELIYKP